MLGMNHEEIDAESDAYSSDHEEEADPRKQQNNELIEQKAKGYTHTRLNHA